MYQLCFREIKSILKVTNPVANELHRQIDPFHLYIWCFPLQNWSRLHKRQGFYWAPHYFESLQKYKIWIKATNKRANLLEWFTAWHFHAEGDKISFQNLSTGVPHLICHPSPYIFASRMRVNCQPLWFETRARAKCAANRDLYSHFKALCIEILKFTSGNISTFNMVSWECAVCGGWQTNLPSKCRCG